MITATLLLAAAPAVVPPAPCAGAQDPFALSLVPAADPLERDAFALLALRELMARWPAGLGAEQLAHHRDLARRLAPAAASDEVSALFAELLDLSARLEEELVSQGLLAPGAVAAVEPIATWFDPDLLPRFGGPEAMGVMHEMASGILAQRGGSPTAAWIELGTDARKLWQRTGETATEGALAAGRPVEAGGFRGREGLRKDVAAHRDDPFTLVAAAEDLAAASKEETASEAVWCAAWYSRAAQLVPHEPALERLRRQLHTNAVTLAATGLSERWFEEGHGALVLEDGEPQEQALDALAICDAALAFEASPETRYHRTVVLNLAGRHREALVEVYRIQDHILAHPDRTYEAACIATSAGELDTGLGLLRRALEGGCSSVAWSREDPELEPLRRERREEFAELTTLRWEWRVGRGEQAGQVVLINTSAFPLTEVTLLPVVLSDGQEVWSGELTVPELPPGYEATWNLKGALPEGELSASLRAREV